VDQSEIEAAAAKGQAAWKTNASEMWRKTALLRLAKIVPLDSQTAGALDDIERGTYDVTPMETTQTPTRRFAPSQPTRMTLPAAPAATAPAETEEADPWHE
jgi:recombinational DNA repair protein RecT